MTRIEESMVDEFIQVYGKRGEVYQNNDWLAGLGFFTVGWLSALNKISVGLPATTAMPGTVAPNAVSGLPSEESTLTNTPGPGASA